MKKIEFVVKFTLEGEEIDTYNEYVANKQVRWANDPLEERLTTASREGILVRALRDQIQAAYDDGYLDGNFNIESVKEEPDPLFSDALDNLETLKDLIDNGRIDKTRVPALYTEVCETLSKAGRLSTKKVNPRSTKEEK